jgi:hypothetical protein
MGDWGEAVLKQIAAAIIGRIGLSSIQYTEDMRAVKMKGVIRRATRAGFSFWAPMARQQRRICVTWRPRKLLIKGLIRSPL